VIRTDARRFENWETNYAGKIGLGVAVDYALSWGLEAIEERVTTLAERFRRALRHVDGVRVHDQGLRRCGIVTFTIDGVPAAKVQQQLASCYTLAADAQRCRWCSSLVPGYRILYGAAPIG
jgi:selenocysteine lyase/cysteine desulfurase